MHTDVLGRLIVRFEGYKSAESHKADLAAIYPTDFALLEVSDKDTARIKVHQISNALYASLQLQSQTTHVHTKLQ